MKNIRFNKQSVSKFFRRFHLVLFVVVTVLLLSIAVLLLSGIVEKASGADSSASSNSPSTFDEATMDRIEQLKTSEEPSEPLNLSQGRINPFSE